MNQIEELSLLERQIEQHTRRLATSLPSDESELYEGLAKTSAALACDPNIPKWAIETWNSIGIRLIHMVRVARLVEDQ